MIIEEETEELPLFSLLGCRLSSHSKHLPQEFGWQLKIICLRAPLARKRLVD
jgi:hypothetical protein